ncbi:hypothetical protein HPB48_007135 [Haemaphysalis longicornis]|uniref:HAP1 N-terminal domain-containing protein n=1 Tax=Haemaphysalis longicornis TaxID=44386 RepID=A0A9J6FSN0_HAELO|nr:hypothetical protein HPB48_007135 [Haemaphysalis longicornis]
MDSVYRYLYYHQDDDTTNLQLAAELGKTLLERNQELEETVRQQQVLIEEQEQELQVYTAHACARDAAFPPLPREPRSRRREPGSRYLTVLRRVLIS